MQKLKRKTLLLGLVLVVTVLVFGIAVYAQQGKNASTTDKNQLRGRAQQLALLASWDAAVVLEVYQAVGDWDKLTKNISVYKQLIVLAEEISGEAQLFELLPKYEATDLYVAYDYFISNNLSTENIKKALELRANGEEWQIILAKFIETKEYKNYQVVSQERLRELLGQGYLPEDIIQADNLAREKDITLNEVLILKTEKNTWESIAETMGHKAKKAKGKNTKDKLKFTVSGVTYELDDQGMNNYIAASKEKDKQRIKAEEKKVKSEFKLNDAQMRDYLDQGFNPWEVRNAYKLAKVNNITPEEVIYKKISGISWEEILSAYPKN